MDVRQATQDDYQALADYLAIKIWPCDRNSQNPATTSAQEFADRATQGFSIFVAFENETILGFGDWKGRYLTSFVADSAEALYRIAREWCIENPGATGEVECPAYNFPEKTWVDQAGTWTFVPFGYEPSDDPNNRTLKTYKGTTNLDEFKVAIDAILGG